MDVKSKGWGARLKVGECFGIEGTLLHVHVHVYMAYFANKEAN